MIGDVPAPRPGPDDLGSALRAARAEVFRFERLQWYEAPGEAAAFAAFRAGLAPPRDPDKDAYLHRVRDQVRHGIRVRRVHAVVEPLSQYMRFELAWEYSANVEAGEDVRIINVGVHSTAPLQDFTLVDDQELYVLHYTDRGELTDVEHVTEPATIKQARLYRDAAMSNAASWREYIDARPGIAALIPSTGVLS